jgi:hypothetical protein
MGTNVDANGRSILHKGHGQIHTCAPPDVCKTPSPGGPVPIPYVNIAKDGDLADGAETVKIEGNPVANVGAKIATSTGDEAGSAGGGIMSSKIKGTVTWKMGSLDVKAEGKSVVRFLDPDFHNGNTFNSAYKNEGGTGMAYGDDFEGKCPVCDKEPAEHKILETEDSAAKCAAIVKELKEQFRSASEKDKADYAKSYKGKWKGYMVGVMICQHAEDKVEPFIFAAMSGGKCLKGFQRIAKSAGKAHVVINDGGAGGEERAMRRQDLMDANTMGGDRKQLIKLVNVVRKKWKTTIEDRGIQNYSCAGAHLVARSNHAPVNMTEMYFAPIGNYPLEISYRRDYNDGLLKRVLGRFGTNVPKTEPTGPTPWGTSVGSCEKCQNLLFLTMCPKRTCK